MKTTSVESGKAPSANGNYAQALEVRDATRYLFVSGQIPQTPDGNVPPRFDDQARLVWANVLHQLEAAGMDKRNIVKCTTFLASREHRDAYRAVRRGVLGDQPVALTVVVADIFDPQWLLEIEVVAAA